MKIEKLKEPIKYEITIIPQPGKDAIIDMKILTGKTQKPIGLEMTFFAFFQIFKSFVGKTMVETDAKDLEKFLGKLTECIKQEEPKVKTFNKLRKLFII